MVELQQLQVSQLNQLTDITNTYLCQNMAGSEGVEFHKKHRSLQEDSGCELMDDSLTDMQWLQRMDAGEREKMGWKGREEVYLYQMLSPGLLAFHPWRPGEEGRSKVG